MSETLAFRTRQLPELVRQLAEKREAGELSAERIVAMARLFGRLGKQAKVEGEDGSEEIASTEVVRSSQAMFLMGREVRAILQGFEDHLGWERTATDEAILQPKKGKNTRMRLADVANECLQADPEADQAAKAPGKTKTTKKLSPQAKATLQDIERRIALLIDGRTADIALFGRMVTSEAFVDVEASSQFAHAISTHKVDHEFDYYTAVDDLERATDDTAGAGADMIGDTEFNSACYYKYFNVHVDGLLENLDPKSEDGPAAQATAATAVRALVEAAVRVSPSAKQNSFAAFQLPSLVLVEVRPDNLPVSYANAFVVPVNPKSGKGVIAESVAALLKEAGLLTHRFGLRSSDRLLLVSDDELAGDWKNPEPSLTALLDKLEAVVRGG